MWNAGVDYVQQNGWYRPKPAGGGGGWASLIPQSGLVNAWSFATADTTSVLATDLIGGKNATLVNCTLAGSGPGSNLNNAAVFNGTTAHGDTALVNLPANFTLCYWVWAAAWTGGQRVIANAHTDSDNTGIQIQVNGTTNRCEVGNGTTEGFADSGTLSTSTWQMVSYTYNGTTITGYTGGSSTGTGGLAGPMASATGTFAFGWNPVFSGGFFAGRIAGVAIYNRVLTTEIATIAGLA